MSNNSNYYAEADNTMRSLGVDAPNYLGGDRPGETHKEYMDRVDAYAGRFGDKPDLSDSDKAYYAEADNTMRSLGVDAPNYFGGDLPGETHKEYMDRVDTYQQQQGGIADSFVAEHNAQQQNMSQTDGQSFEQPKNDGPELD